MKIYLPYYDRGWKTLEADSTHSRYWHTPGYPANLIYQGTNYCADNIYSDPAGVQLYIEKQYNKARKYEIRPFDKEA